MGVDREAAEAAIRAFLAALGHDPELHPEFRETPGRVTRAFADELLVGYRVNVPELIARGSELTTEGKSSDPVIVDEISVATVCPHHLLVAEGKAAVAYVPGQRILGLGTVARLVDAVSRRLVLQESIATEVVDALMTHAGARGACCRLVMNHACLRARGPTQSSARAVTIAARGNLEDPARWAPLLGPDGSGESTRGGA